MAELRKRLGLSERRACRAVGQSRSSQRYQTKPRSDEPRLLKRLLQLVRRRPRFGYRRIAALLRGEGYAASESRILRLWRREGLKVPQKKRKKRRLGVAENGCDRLAATHKNHVWAWDFAFDRTENGTQLKWLSIVDEHTRECLALKVARSITSEDLIDTVAELLAMRGVPENVRSDNGPEFVAEKLRAWLAQVGVRTRYVEPASPWQNGYAESFHSRLRDEFLAIEVFDNLAAARKLTAVWREDYNHYRPHGSMGYVTPAEFAARCPASAPESLSAMPQATPPLQQSSGFTHPLPS